MFGISKREITNRIAAQIIKDLREKGAISVPHIGVLLYDRTEKTVKFQQDPGLLEELQDK